MAKEWFVRAIQATVITVVLAEERHWHGKLGFIPYDFRLPTIERLKQAYWNPESDSIFGPEAWGIGWAVNFHALLEKMRVIGESYLSEDDYLMPTRSLRHILENRPVMESPPFPIILIQQQKN